MSQPQTIQYYQIRVQKIMVTVDSKQENMLLISVEPITSLLKAQQKICDELYQEAIEANYSHEQMTPLNSILGNSTVLIDEFQKIFTENRSGLISSEDCVRKMVENLRFLQAIQQSGKIMYYYNLNQIYRMKIRKNEFKTR